jgi:hypothetical protein
MTRPAICSDNRSCKYGASCIELPHAAARVGVDCVKQTAQASHIEDPVGGESAVSLDGRVTLVTPSQQRLDYGSRSECSDGAMLMRGGWGGRCGDMEGKRGCNGDESR